MDEQMIDMDGWMKEQIMDIDGCMEGWKDGCMNGRMNEQMMDG